MATTPADDEAGGAGRGAQTLNRGLDLLELAVSEPMRMAELAERSGLSRGTAIRLATALVDRRFLTRNLDGRLHGGAKLLRLGALAEQRHDLVSVARPNVTALSARTGLSSFLGRRDGDHSVHLFRAQGIERVMVATPVGTRRILSETSMGKALMFDDEPATWSRLFALAAGSPPGQEVEIEMRAHIARGAVIHQGPPPDSICAVASPVRDSSGKIVGAISMATIAQYLKETTLEELANEVRHASACTSASLGWSPSNGLSD